MEKKIASNIALLIFLLAITLAVLLPILANSPLSDEEGALLASIHSLRSHDLASVFRLGGDVNFNFYAYLTGLIINLMKDMNPLFVLRLTSAVIIAILTLCLFNFDATSRRLNTSFLASLLFLSCGLSVKYAYTASPILIPSSLFIFALMNLYHCLHQRTRRNFGLLIGSTAIATIFMGVTVPVTLLIIASVFIGASHGAKSLGRLVEIAASLIAASFLSLLSIYMLLGDLQPALHLFSIEAQLESMEDTNFVYLFMNYIIFAIFPWSIPIAISCIWLVRNPRWVIDHFINLNLLQRFGIVIFLFSIPSLFFATKLSIILITASTFFNMPLMGRYLLSQFDNHANTWRVSGLICAIIVGSGTVLFAILQWTGSIGVWGSFTVATTDGGWSVWSAFITFFIFLNIYQMWRNARDIHTNHRYLYNIITLYIAAVILFVGYINA